MEKKARNMLLNVFMVGYQINIAESLVLVDDTKKEQWKERMLYQPIIG